jgi:hypothetical protein
VSIRDRGTIKWQGFFMPEHKKMLREAWEEDKKQKKPVLDEQEIEIFNQNLAESLQNSTLISIKLYKNGYIESFGPVKVLQVDLNIGKIKVIDEKEYIHYLRFDDVVGSELV